MPAGASSSDFGSARRIRYRNTRSHPKHENLPWWQASAASAAALMCTARRAVIPSAALGALGCSWLPWVAQGCLGYPWAAPLGLPLGPSWAALGGSWTQLGPNLGPTWSELGLQDSPKDAPRAPFWSYVLPCRMEIGKSGPTEVKNDSFGATESLRHEAACVSLEAYLEKACLHHEASKTSQNTSFLPCFSLLHSCGEEKSPS